MRRKFYLAAFLVGIPLILLGLFIARKDARSRLSRSVLVDEETIDAAFHPETTPGVAAMTALISVKAPQTIRVGQSATVSVEAIIPQKTRLMFRLSASGLEVQPNDWVPLHALDSNQHLVANWSIRASSPGSYSLVFNLKNEQQQVVAVHFIDGNNIEMKVVRGWSDYLSMVSGPFVAFMGSLLTLPGIVSFLKDRKREREEKRKAIQTFE
jgi:hypothetical protein